MCLHACLKVHVLITGCAWTDENISSSGRGHPQRIAAATRRLDGLSHSFRLANVPACMGVASSRAVERWHRLKLAAKLKAGSVAVRVRLAECLDSSSLEY